MGHAGTIVSGGGEKRRKRSRLCVPPVLSSPTPADIGSAALRARVRRRPDRRSGRLPEFEITHAGAEGPPERRVQPSAALRTTLPARPAKSSRTPKVQAGRGAHPSRACSPLDPGSDATRWSATSRRSLAIGTSMRRRNPFGNSVKLLALDIGKRLDKGNLGFPAKSRSLFSS